MHWTQTVNRYAPYAEGSQPEWLLGWGAAIGPDWSVYWAGFNRDKEAAYRVDLKGWTAAGVPQYDLNAAHRIMLTDNPGEIQGLYCNDEGRLFASYSYEYDPKGKDAFACFDRDGHYLWGIARPKTQGSQDVEADNVAGEFHVPGLGSVLGTWLWHANYRPYLVTADGLYLSTLLDETRLGPTAKWDESFKFYYQDPGSAAVTRRAIRNQRRQRCLSSAENHRSRHRASLHRHATPDRRRCPCGRRGAPGRGQRPAAGTAAIAARGVAQHAARG